MRVVITHPEMGIYIGSCLGLGFWTMLDTAGQQQVVTFESEREARDFVATWDENADPATYSYVPIREVPYASVEDLIKAGLADLIGDMHNAEGAESMP